ncbi:hypothetical protein AB0L00_15885 [Actinoallomurus sp. NPDC052308]|uniref:hypothetical protein n=1 Tax=Actinoallomurus sp. NPDC052308 TaxID=3155530 RepID=UPI003417AF44
MTRLIDRLLARVAPKATASAGCSRSNYCYRGLYYLRVCCLNEGCNTAVVGACGSP